MLPMSAQNEREFDTSVDLGQEGIVEGLVKATRIPLLLPHKVRLPSNGVTEERDVIYCYIPPAGSVWNDKISVTKEGQVEFFSKSGESRGKPILKVLTLEEATDVYIRRQKILREITLQIREAKLRKANALTTTNNR